MALDPDTIEDLQAIIDYVATVAMSINEGQNQFGLGDLVEKVLVQQDTLARALLDINASLP